MKVSELVTDNMKRNLQGMRARGTMQAAQNRLDKKVKQSQDNYAAAYGGGQTVVGQLLERFNIIDPSNSRTLIDLWNRTHLKPTEPIHEVKNIRVRDRTTGKYMAHNFGQQAPETAPEVEVEES